MEYQWFLASPQQRNASSGTKKRNIERLQTFDPYLHPPICRDSRQVSQTFAGEILLLGANILWLIPSPKRIEENGEPKMIWVNMISSY